MLFETEAIVLKTYDFSEADRIVVLFTKTEGKLRAVAKSVRKINSKLSGSLGLLNHSLLQLSGHENRDLFRLIQAQIFTSFPFIKNNLVFLAQAARMAELVDIMTHDRQAVPELFELLKQSLVLMEERHSPDLVSIWFEVRFWDVLGYGFNLANCFLCKRETEKMSFDLEGGGFVCHNCRPESTHTLSRGSRKILDKMKSGQMIYLSRILMQDCIGNEIRMFLDRMIRFHSGKTLKSDIFRDAVFKLE